MHLEQVEPRPADLALRVEQRAEIDAARLVRRQRRVVRGRGVVLGAEVDGRVAVLKGVEAGQQVVASGELPDNVRLCGYVASAEQALAQVDVVLNLSHFQESFGRTVLEAMQAGRVVVAYDWGALPELVTPGHGFLVPFKDIAAVSAILLQLHNDRTLLQATAERAMQYARQHFSAAILQQSLQAYFKEVIK